MLQPDATTNSKGAKVALSSSENGQIPRKNSPHQMRYIVRTGLFPTVVQVSPHLACSGKSTKHSTSEEHSFFNKK